MIQPAFNLFPIPSSNGVRVCFDAHPLSGKPTVFVFKEGEPGGRGVDYDTLWWVLGNADKIVSGEALLEGIGLCMGLQPGVLPAPGVAMSFLSNLYATLTLCEEEDHARN